MTTTSKSPRVSIVILNYNTKDLLRQFLPYVLKTAYENFEVVVADNGSTDGSALLVEQNFPEVKLVVIPENLGFAGGYNYVLSKLDTPYHVLLNSDVEVSGNWLQPMMDLILSRPGIAAVQPKILDYNHHDQFEYAGASGGYIDILGYPFCRGRIFETIEKDEGQHDMPKPVFWASGAAMLVRADDYMKVGGLDSDFFAHMEEIDLCWRLQHEGKEIWVCPEAIVYHMGGGTLSAQSSHKTFLNFRNNLALLFKNLPAGELVPTFLARLVLDGVAGVKYLLSGKASHTLAIIKAHWNFYFKINHWYQKRKLVEVKRPLSELTGLFNSSLVWSYYIGGKKTYDKIFGKL